MDIFTNREIASAVWIIIFFIILMLNQKCRSAFYKVIKTALSIKILMYTLISVIYFVGLMILINKVILIDLSLVKDAIIWFVVSGLVLTANSFSSIDSKNIIRDHILENIKVTVIIEFILATYVFSIWIELVIIPIILFVSLVNAVSANDENSKTIHRLTSIIEGIIGWVVFGFALINAVTDYCNFIGIASIKSFVLPLLLMIAYFPFSYCWILYAKYEVLFAVIKQMYKNKNSEQLGKKIIIRIARFCGLNFNRVSAIRDNKYFFWHYIEDENQIDEFIDYNRRKVRKVYTEKDI
jgi:hypothetical protein